MCVWGFIFNDDTFFLVTILKIKIDFFTIIVIIGGLKGIANYRIQLYNY